MEITVVVAYWQFSVGLNQGGKYRYPGVFEWGQVTGTLDRG